MSNEETCPLCDTPRPRGAKRCQCNYVFEYEPQMLGGSGSTSGLSTTPPRGVLVAAAIAFIAVFVFMRAQRDVRGNDGAGLLLVPIGIFALCGAIFDWDWFFNSRRARLFVSLFGRAGARLFYAALGGAMSAVGVALALA